MKRKYINPTIFVESIENECQFLAGSIPPKTEDYTGGGETGPGEGEADADVGAKKNGIFFLDDEW